MGFPETAGEGSFFVVCNECLTFYGPSMFSFLKIWSHIFNNSQFYWELPGGYITMAFCYYTDLHEVYCSCSFICWENFSVTLGTLEPSILTDTRKQVKPWASKFISWKECVLWYSVYSLQADSPSGKQGLCCLLLCVLTCWTQMHRLLRQRPRFKLLPGNSF